MRLVWLAEEEAATAGGALLWERGHVAAAGMCA